MGNFVFDRDRTDTKQSAIFDLVYQQGTGWRIWITPVWISWDRLGPEYTTGARCGEILDHVIGLSECLGTAIELASGRGYVECAYQDTARPARPLARTGAR